jgi:hypothetical protein
MRRWAEFIFLIVSFSQRHKHVNTQVTCFRGAFPPVDLRAVCFVRAIAMIDSYVAITRFYVVKGDVGEQNVVEFYAVGTCEKTCRRREFQFVSLEVSRDHWVL